MYFAGAAQSIDDAGELDQQPVARGLDEPAAMLGDLRVDHLGSKRLEPTQRAVLVDLDQPGIPGDIGYQDRREAAFDRLLHGLSLPCRS
jgi:hypothetical protein